MVIVLGTTFATGAVLVLALYLLVRRLVATGGCLPVTPEWIGELSAERYQPMLRLLDSEDIRFLRSQPGYSRRIEARLRAQRSVIFTGYLRSLSTDFGRVCMALRVLMVQSRYDRPDLASVLVTSEARFAASMIFIWMRLFLYRYGFCSVNARPLVEIFDSMRLELRSLVPVTAGAAV